MITVTIVIILLSVAIYRYLTRNYNYWTTRGVKHDKPLLIFGNNKASYLLQKNLTEILADTYRRYPTESVVGFYRSAQPALVIRDPGIIKRILFDDFGFFYPRGLLPYKTNIEPLLRNLFFVDGDMWRLLRQRMTPAFTSGKLKAMFPLIVERAEQLQARVLQAASSECPLDARDLMARYTIDFIGACGFGLDGDALNDDDSEFRKLGAQIFTTSIRDSFVSVIKELMPDLCKDFKYTKRVEKDFLNLVYHILAQRNNVPSNRNDIIDLFLEYKKNGIIVGKSLEEFEEDGTPKTISLEFTEELIAAQLFIFFAAGFETSSSATSFTLHQLAFHPDVQNKVQANIDLVLMRHNNKLSYDAVREMTYLEWAFKESMRMFPPLGYLVRNCARLYTIPELGFSINEGVRVFIPLQALHNDPKYFKEPEVFQPERFDPVNFDVQGLKYIYLPFGDGPRACIGARMGLMQSLAGLATVLSKFTVEPAPNTLKYPKVDPKSEIIQGIQNGLPLIFRERKNVKRF